jgi:pimeloyl-ACP methyl ester carboxylesterase
MLILVRAAGSRVPEPASQHLFNGEPPLRIQVPKQHASFRNSGVGTKRCSRARVFCAVLTVLVVSLTSMAPRVSAAAIDPGREIDIGGRKLYLVCGGQLAPGRPTVVLVSGYHDSSDPWTQADVLSLLPGAVGPPVLPGLARNQRVCAYDRPGTLRYIDGLPLTSRSTAVTQPRTARDLTVELHELLSAARVPPPYVLVGHSLGGLVVLLYARTYPHEVGGIVFVDSFSPTIPNGLGVLWPRYRAIINPPSSAQPLASLKLAASETILLDESIKQLEQAPPLATMPLAVLTKTEPFRIPAGALPSGITLPQIDAGYNDAEKYFVALMPETPQIFATGSEHYIQLSQPDLVISATELIVRRAVSTIR